MAPPRLSLSGLADDLLETIALAHGDVEVFLRLRETCTAFRDVLTIRDDTDAAADRLPGLVPRTDFEVRRLGQSGSTFLVASATHVADALHRLGDNFRASLRGLRIHGRGMTPHQPAVPVNGDVVLPSLRYLRASDVSWNSGDVHLPELRVAYFDGNGGATDDDSRGAVFHAPRVHTMRFSNTHDTLLIMHGSHEPWVQAFPDVMPTVTSLVVGDINNQVTDNLDDVVSRFPALRHLAMGTHPRDLRALQHLRSIVLFETDEKETGTFQFPMSLESVVLDASLIDFMPSDDRVRIATVVEYCHDNINTLYERFRRLRVLNIRTFDNHPMDMDTLVPPASYCVNIKAFSVIAQAVKYDGDSDAKEFAEYVMEVKARVTIQSPACVDFLLGNGCAFLGQLADNLAYHGCNLEYSHSKKSQMLVIN